MNDDYGRSYGFAEQSTFYQSTMTKVYGWMTIALIISAVVGIMIAGNGYLLAMCITTPLHWIFAIAEFVIVCVLSAKVRTLSDMTAKILFVIYAILNGVTFGLLFAVYGLGTVGYAFLITAITFAVMSAYGYFTKTDLSSFGNLFMMALVGIIIATIVNFFIGSTRFYYILSYITIAVFIGLIGYDTQKIKYYVSNGVRNAAILGALELYLDFINIFIRVVRIVAKSDR